jgi:hypothetical protein
MMDVRRARCGEPNRQRHLPQVVVEHGRRLVQPVVAVGICREAVRQVREVLSVDAVIGVEVRDNDPGGVVAKTNQLRVQPAAEVGHRARLTHDHPGLERIEDVEEVREVVAKDLASPRHVLPPGQVSLARDDGHDLPLAYQSGSVSARTVASSVLHGLV